MKCESAEVTKYKMRKWNNAEDEKCENYIKSNGHAILATIYSSACLQVTLAYVVVNLQRVA